MDYNGVMTTITTRLGVIEGANRNGVEQFLGIRYAEAPVGDRRFLPPVMEKLRAEGLLEAWLRRHLEGYFQRPETLELLN